VEAEVPISSTTPDIGTARRICNHSVVAGLHMSRPPVSRLVFCIETLCYSRRWKAFWRRAVQKVGGEGTVAGRKTSCYTEMLHGECSPGVNQGWSSELFNGTFLAWWTRTLAEWKVGKYRRG